jgi:hypothetical protein
VTTTEAKAATAATTQKSMMTIKLASSCNQKPKTTTTWRHNGSTEDSCNKTVAVIRQLQRSINLCDRAVCRDDCAKPVRF